MPCSRGCCPTPRDHWRSVVIGSAPAESDKFDGGYTRKFDSDMNAYAELRKGGVQPERVDGSADLLRKVDSGLVSPDSVTA